MRMGLHKDEGTDWASGDSPSVHFCEGDCLLPFIFIFIFITGVSAMYIFSLIALCDSEDGSNGDEKCCTESSVLTERT